jgi:hypothetical protein
MLNKSQNIMPPASEKPNDLIVRGKQIRALKNHHEEVGFFYRCGCALPEQ